MLLLFFSILACNTSNTSWLIYSRSQHLTRLANDFPVFLLNQSKLPMCSYYFFLFWPVTLQTMTFLPFLLNRSKLPICSYYFFLLACNTSSTYWLIYSLSQHLTSLANDFPAFFAQPVEVTNMLILFFSILAFNTSNTKWLIYSLSQHLTRLANAFFAQPVEVTNMLIHYFFLLACNTSSTYLLIYSLVNTY